MKVNHLIKRIRKTYACFTLWLLDFPLITLFPLIRFYVVAKITHSMSSLIIGGPMNEDTTVLYGIGLVINVLPTMYDKERSIQTKTSLPKNSMSAQVIISRNVTDL